MAAVFVPPSPQTTFAMSSRRTPLANVPNGTNSPHRGSLVATKRARTGSQLDIAFGQPPPKRQLIDRDDPDSRSPIKTRPTSFSQGNETKVFLRRTTQPTAFEKKLVAARDKEKLSQSKGSKYEKSPVETHDTVRQWQKHYRKAFPQFVFYFDSIQEDLRHQCSKQVTVLGASEEKFFSRLVTHVVTSRSIPPEVDSPSSVESSIARRPTDDSPRTVNPSLLERPNEPHPHLSSKPKSLNDRRPETDARRDQNNDVLHRARQMGMKIWALEKLQRMITTINDGDSIASHGRSNNGGASARTRDTNLSQVLQNERLNGSLNRDPLASMKDILMFKGPFIYVHDIEEKTRPVMVREYSRVTRRQDGAWPQFRSAPLGKCPFLDEQQPSKKTLREKDKKPAVQAQPNAENKAKTMHPPELRVEKKVVQGVSEPNECRVEEKGQAPKQVEQPKAVPTRPPSPRKSSESFIVPSLTHTGPFHLGREPAASGVQPSNITSAIRSQMISSTAAAPGTKGSVSREIHELKRKVLEKNNAGISMATGLSSHPRAEASRTLNPVVGTSNRSNKYKMPEKLGQIHEEDTTHSEDNGNKKPSTTNRKVDGHKKNRENRKDPKPGYCENCRDKFDDFDEHIATRKHRKFAATASNWAELDTVLYQLQQPLKEYDYV